MFWFRFQLGKSQEKLNEIQKHKKKSKKAVFLRTF